MTIVNFSKVRVLVVGDVMLDRYWHGAVDRISPEAPVPIAKIIEQEERVGGAANVALNLATLDATVTLMGAIARDDMGAELAAKLKAAGIHSEFFYYDNAPTITKLRVVSRHQQLIRLDFEGEPPEFNREAMLDAYREALDHTDVVILSDYGKGILSEAAPFIAAAKEHRRPVLVDPKNPDFSAYSGATMITPNMKEFIAAVGPCLDEETLVKKAQELIHRCDLKALLITRSEKGMTLIADQLPEIHLPAKVQEVYDVTGAGDTVIAVMALAIGAGFGFEKAMHFANAAAGVVVGKFGAATASLPELQHMLDQEEEQQGGGILNESQLLLAVVKAKARGETVVMTNGCFDILHAGHVHYLKQARALGDRLIVAVNDDASVKKLKGPSRPINHLAQRMQVLSALESVDWVVPFSEDTPERLISEILPDILVKGGDYRPEEIAGGRQVMENGGRVEILDFVEGLSTTRTIHKMQGEEE